MRSSPSSLQWMSLVATIWLQASSGTNFNFPAYSSQLKSHLSMSQLQLNNLAFASDAGKLFGWFSGLAAARFPLWFLLLTGSLLGSAGYGAQYLFLALPVSSVAYWQVFALSTLAGNSICWINTVCYVVLINNFPSNRQAAVGLSTSYQGLSAKIYTAIVDVALSYSPTPTPTKRAKAYLLFSMVLPPLVCAVTAPFARQVSEDGFSRERTRPHRERGFVLLFAITIGTGVFAVFSSLRSTSRALSPLGNAIGLAVFLAAPLLAPLSAKNRELWRQKKWASENRVHVIAEQELEAGGPKDGDDSNSHTDNSSTGEIKVDDRENDGGGVDEECLRDGQVVAEEVEASVMVRRTEFWLYFFVYMFGASIGLVFLNNLGQIADSRGSYSGAGPLVSLSSAFGFFGRLVPSLLDFFFSGSKPAASMAALMAPMCGAFFLLLHASEAALYVSTAVIGVCTGAITSLAISVTTELFGVKHFSTNHNVLVSNIPLGSFLFGTLAAVAYRREGRRVGGSDGGVEGGCVGTACYRWTFLAWGCLCCAGTILAWALHARTRRLRQT